MSLIDEIKIDSLQEAQEILKGIGSEELFEKAHKDGDMHPNGKWVWVSSANKGKGDWRTLNGRTHKNHQANSGASSTSSSSTTITTAQPQPKSKTSTSSIATNISIDKTQYDKIFKQAQGAIKRDGHISSVSMGLSVVKGEIKELQDKLSDLRKNRPGAKKTIKETEDKLNLYKTKEKAMTDAIEDFNSKEKAKSTNASPSKSQTATKVDKIKTTDFKQISSDTWELKSSNGNITMMRGMLPGDYSMIIKTTDGKTYSVGQGNMRTTKVLNHRDDMDKAVEDVKNGGDYVLEGIGAAKRFGVAFLNSLTTNNSSSEEVLESTDKPIVPNSLIQYGNRGSRQIDKLYKEFDDKYKNYEPKALKDLGDKIDGNVNKQRDRYNRLKSQGESKITINKEGNALDELIARSYTIHRLLSQLKKDGGDIKTLSSKDFDKNPKLLDSLLKNANVKKNDKGETFYHVTISSHGVKKHNLWLSKPEVKSRLSMILNPYDEVTAVSKKEDDDVSKEVKKKIASIKPHIVTDAALGKVEYFDYDENKKKRLHDLSSDAAWLSNGKSKNLGFDYKTDDGRSVHIDIKVTKNKKENTFEIKNGSKGDAIEFSISNQMSYDVQNKELDDKIKESIESRVNKGIKTTAVSKNKIETDGSKLTLTQRKQNLSNVVDKFKTAIQDKINKLKLNSEYKIETGDRYISVSRKNNNFRKGAGSGGTFAFDYNGKDNKLMITRKAPLSGSTEFDFDENDIKDNVDKFFKFYSIK